jgi:hypothetical protein
MLSSISMMLQRRVDRVSVSAAGVLCLVYDSISDAHIWKLLLLYVVYMRHKTTQS